MYSDVTFIEELRDKAQTFIMDNDRMMYRPFFEEIERSLSTGYMVLGGQIGLDLLLAEPLSRDSFFWEAHAVDAFASALSLARALTKVHSPHIPTRTVALRTDIRNKEFTLLVYGRMLMKIYAIDRVSQVADLIGAVKRKGYFTDSLVYCMPPELQLMSVYRALYSPQKAALWPKLLDVEGRLTNIKREVVAGSGEAHSIGMKLVSTLADKYGREDMIIGDYALAAYALDAPPSMRLQVITARAIDVIVADATAALKKLNNRTKLQIARAPHQPILFGDFQLMKYVLSLRGDRDSFDLCDVYNSAQYELVPYTTYKGRRVGNIWVMLRFTLIDLWSLRIINATAKSSAIEARIERVRARFNALHERRPAELSDSGTYLGVQKDENVEKKKLIADTGERLPVIYPAIAKKEDIIALPKLSNRLQAE